MQYHYQPFVCVTFLEKRKKNSGVGETIFFHTAQIHLSSLALKEINLFRQYYNEWYMIDRIPYKVHFVLEEKNIYSVSNSVFCESNLGLFLIFSFPSKSNSFFQKAIRFAASWISFAKRRIYISNLLWEKMFLIWFTEIWNFIYKII